MGLGILEDHKLEHVPGTANVLEDERMRQEEQMQARDANRKYDKTGKILLVPQPSNDPNDPLVRVHYPSEIHSYKRYVLWVLMKFIYNWPLWQRDLIVCILSLISVIAATLSPLLAIYFQRSFTDMALLTGYHLLGVGFAGFLFVPSARIWGKRHIYLLGAVTVIYSSAWGGANGKKYKSLLWARIFQGIGLAPFEALVNASVGDLYFVHERGLRMALMGKLAADVGYEWTFYFVAIFTAILLPLLFFFCPETTYRREQRFDIDTMGNLVGQTPPSVSKEMAVESSASTSSDLDRAGNGTNIEGVGRQSHPRTKVSWKRSLLPFNGRHTDERYLHLLLRPFPLFLHPGILWACLIQGALIGWTVMIGVVLAAIMLGNPLWVGDMSVEGFTCLLVFKNIFSFALTFKGFEWIQRGKVKPVFTAIASVQVGICMLTVPCTSSVKKSRSFFHRHNVYFKLTDAIADKIMMPLDWAARKLLGH
ncbi:MFS general substrate transporter [Karstenula rhodostoma CBS 690.94]|uniref:MFS general substrate transporter n=1 Tax=Karstenula rhodostoma CBS 690.94 TaxID=1392251 RepID=A0A9P4PA77_9PLEO|nr:MFS general substrate transporter [Karstenula rhodostoma CBS 690.94]